MQATPNSNLLWSRSQHHYRIVVTLLKYNLTLVLFLTHADFPLIFWCRFDSFSWFAGLVSAKELKNAPLCRANIAYNISKAQLQRISIKKVRSIQRLTFFFEGHGTNILRTCGNFTKTKYFSLLETHIIVSL